MANGPQVRMRVVTIVHEYLDHETGHWCRPCALPSGVRAWIVIRSDEGWMRIAEGVACYKCGSHDVVIDDDHRVT